MHRVLRAVVRPAMATAIAKSASGHAGRTPNRLASEKSPYLLQHQYNPVDWYPWGPTALQKARDEDKPIFLSVGYSSCHWCHVMERESFESEDIAQLMNEFFVNIKVDREERPDVDRMYMTFVQALTGGGGWPMSCFLTPDLKPFMAGTYYPPEAFGGILIRLGSAWRSQRASVMRQAERMLAAVREATERHEEGPPPSRRTAERAITQFERMFDDKLGGFGKRPKFPRPVTFNFLLAEYALSRAGGEGAADRLLHMVTFTLDAMARGGMHDHLGGGFHRYSVDDLWRISHFEKMLYDQAQLAVSYADAYQITGRPQYAATLRDTLGYVLRDLCDRQTGGFYCAEDADSFPSADAQEKREGAFYVWSMAEVRRVLGDQAAAFAHAYGLRENGNAPPGSDPHGEFTNLNVLYEASDAADVGRRFGMTADAAEMMLADARRRMFEAREQRPRPFLDDKILTAWNGLMLSGLCRGAQVLNDPQYLAAAVRAADWLRRVMFDDSTGTLRRSFREGPSAVQGFSQDYSFMVAGLLDLYESTLDGQWLAFARRLQSTLDAQFWDAAHGAYFDAPASPDILLRLKEDYDGAEPAPSSLAALNLARLSLMTDSHEMMDRAALTVQYFAAQLDRAPHATPQLLVAHEFVSQQERVPLFVVAGEAGVDETGALLRTLHSVFMPFKAIVRAADVPAAKHPQEQIDGRPTVHVLLDGSRVLSTSDPVQLQQWMRQHTRMEPKAAPQ